MSGNEFFATQMAGAVVTTQGNGHDQLHQSGQEEDSVQNRYVRKTLAVFLGGTGQRIAVNLKALYMDSHGGLPDWLRIIVLDTANEPLAIPLDGGRLAQLESGTEFVNIGKVPVRRIIQNRDQQRAISERFGDSLLHLPAVTLLHGAKQIRPYGLLAFLWHYRKVEEKIRTALWQLAGRDSDQSGLISDEHGINVFVVNSLCGGTGAGIFLDVAFLIRALVEELGDLGEFCQVTGVGVLPGAFPGIDGPNLLPNTVASLVELNHAMMHNDFTATYPNGRVIEAAGAPFDLYYVIDGVDDRGRVWLNHNAVCRMAARALYLQMGSQLGRKGENIFDNLDEVVSRVTADDVGCFLGSIGVSIIRFDAQSAHDLCVRYHARRMLREGWLQELQKEQSDEARDTAESFWTAQGLSTSGLLDTLAVDDEGLPLVVDLSLPGSIRRLSAADQAVRAVSYVKEYETVRIDTTFRQAIATRRSLRTTAVTAAMRDLVSELCQDIESGPLRARAFLAALRVLLDQARSELKQHCSELENETETLVNDQERHQQELLRVAKAGFFVRAMRVAAAQQNYLESASDALTCKLEYRLASAGLQVLDQLSQVQSELEHAVVQVIRRLTEAARAIDTARLEADMFDTAVDLELLDPDYVSELYQSLAPALSTTAAELLDEKMGLLGWARRPSKDLLEALYTACEVAFKPVLHWGVERVLRDQADQVSPAIRHGFLSKQAVGSWNLDRTRMADGGTHLVSLTVLGVPNEQDTMLDGDGDTLVSTHDANQLVALGVNVGAPHTALQQFPTWQRAYEEARSKRHSLHVLPAYHTDEGIALKGFALGLIFGLITTQGAWYYYHPVDPLEERLQLGQGLANAVKTFAAQEGLAQAVVERVERHVMSQMTTAQAIERLEAYYKAGTRMEDSLDRELRRAAREYALKLREVLSASQGIVA